MKNYFTLLLLVGVLFMTSCSKDEKDEVPENDIISFTVNGPGLTNYEFETNGMLGNIIGLSTEISGFPNVGAIVENDDIECGLGFNGNAPGTYNLVNDNLYTVDNENAANILAIFTVNGIEYYLESESGTMEVQNVDITSVSGTFGAGLASGNGTFSGTFISYDSSGNELETYQVTNGVFKFSKGM